MKSGYLKDVLKRSLSLGKTFVKEAVPVLIDGSVVTVIEKICSKIEQSMKAMYRRTGINSAISFALNLCGVLILIFKPFGEKPSRYVTYGFFAAAFIFWLVRTIIFFVKNGETCLKVIKNIWHEKSVYNGIEKYVLSDFPNISSIYYGISIASVFIPHLKEVPQISELVKYLVHIFWKRIALYAGIMAVYTVTVFWIIKPILVHRFY